MKSFKIVNLFIFLFVINLSITFLYKNNLFATFINSVLQTDDKNLWQRKQRGLAEAGTSSQREVSRHLLSNIENYVSRYCDAYSFALNDILASLGLESLEKRMDFITDKTKYCVLYKSRMGFQKFSPHSNEIDIFFDKLTKLMSMISLEGNLQSQFSKVLKTIETENMFVKLILYDCFSDTHSDFRQNLNYGYVKHYIETHPKKDDSESLALSLDDKVQNILDRCNIIIDNLKRDNIIS